MDLDVIEGLFMLMRIMNISPGMMPPFIVFVVTVLSHLLDVPWLYWTLAKVQMQS